MLSKTSDMLEDQPRTTATILDEYCRYFADFSKVLGIYVKNFYPQLNFELEHLLDASFNVWQRLNDKEKFSLANFLEEINQEGNHAAGALVASPSDVKAFSSLINAELLTTKLKYPQTWKKEQTTSSSCSNRFNSKSMPMNASSNMTSSRSLATVLKKTKPIPITPFHIYLKDERKKFIQKHAKMSMRDINKCLSERWQKMSNRMKQTYEYRAYLAKKRLYKKQTAASINDSVALKKVPKMKSIPKKIKSTRVASNKNNRVKSLSSHLSSNIKAKLHAGNVPSDKKLLSNSKNNNNNNNNNNNRAGRNL